MKRLALILCFHLMAGQAWGATYTVCSSSCDHTTIQAAFDGHDLGNDDVVEVRAASPGETATYRETVTWGSNDAGSSGHPVTLQGRTGDTIIISGANLVSSWSGTGPIWTATVTTQPYVVIVDGTVGNRKTASNDVDSELDWYWESNTLTLYSVASPSGRVVESGARNKVIDIPTSRDYLTISNLTIQGSNGLPAIDNRSSWITYTNITVEKGRHSALQLYGPSNHISISNSTFIGIGANGNVAASGIVTTCNNAASISDNIAITNVDVTGFALNGIWIFGYNDGNRTSEITISNSNVSENGAGIYLQTVSTGTVDNCTMDSNTRTDGAGEGAGLAYQSASSITASRNTMRNNRLSGVQIWGDDSPAVPTDGSRVTRCAISSNGQYGIFFNGPNVDNTVIDSNLIYGNTLSGINYSSSSNYATGNVVYNNTVTSEANYPFRLTSSGAGLTLKNNLFYSINSNPALYDPSGVGDLEAHSNNLYWSAGSGLVDYGGTVYTSETTSTFEATGIGSDPLFASATTGDFSLTQGSPAIDHGTDLGATYATDYSGQDQRRWGRGWEIGAFVFPASGMGGM